MLKKIPPYKKVEIFIDNKHELFNHKRWSQQLAELIKEQHINATFLVTTKDHFAYFNDVGLSVRYKKKAGIGGLIETVKEIIASPSASKQILNKKNTKSYLVLATEIAVLILFGTFFWGLISPKATLTITPANQIVPIIYQYGFYPAGGDILSRFEHLDKIIIPYYTASIPYNQDMTIDVQDVVYTYTQARGTVSFENTLSDEISLVGGTQLVTTGGVLFTIDSRVNIPGGTQENPGKATMTVTARPSGEDGLPVGEKSNIPRSTALYIKNLPASIEEQRVVAYASSNFSGGSTTGKGTVLQNDIDLIEQQIIASMRRNKVNHLKEQIRNKDDILLIPYDELMDLRIERFVSTSTVGESATFVHGAVSGRVSYTYIYRKDFLDAVHTFISQRPQNNKYLHALDEQSILFHEFRPNSEHEEYFRIPISINSIWHYTFQDDYMGIIDSMIHAIAGKRRTEARNILLEYPQVRDVIIRFSPRWYDTLPTDPQRITIK